MKNSSKAAIVAGLGAIAGGVVGFYLNSDKGREQLKQATSTIKDQSAKASNYLNDVASRAKDSVANMATSVQNSAQKATNKAQDVKNDLVDASNKQLEKVERNYGNGFQG